MFPGYRAGLVQPLNPGGDIQEQEVRSHPEGVGREQSQRAYAIRQLRTGSVAVVAREVVKTRGGLDHSMVEETQRVRGIEPDVLQGLMAFPEKPGVKLLDGQD